MSLSDDTMLAAEYDGYGPAAVLQVRRVPRPMPAAGEALVRVEASTVNPIDLVVRSGKLRFRTGKRFPKRVGIDFAGVVEEIGPDAAGLATGDHVFGVMPLTIEKGVGQGSAAQYVTIEAERLAQSPSNVGPVEAAALSSVGAVALITLRDKAALKPGERLLIRGAAGGVGSVAVQVGALLGAHVTALASNADLGFLRDLGAAEALDYRAVKPSDLEPFDVIVDLVGTNLRRWRKLQSPQGRMFCLGVAGFGTIGYIAVSRIYGSRRVRFFSAAPTGETMRELAAQVESGAVRSVVHSTYDLSDIVAAQQSLEAGGGRGKRVLVHSPAKRPAV